MTTPGKRSDTAQLLSGAVQEVARVLEDGAAKEAERLCDELLAARRIACYGVGREGLMMRALCMRLMHLGLDAHVVGDMTTPHVGKKDLLVVSAGPGTFSTVIALIGVARSAGARVAVVTAQPEGEAPKLADAVIHIKAQTMADDRGGASVLPMGSLYEAALLLFFDIVSILLRERTGQSTESMRSRHTNLE
ncbi:MAG TPA: 6-phospho-3-hexuloisomerase [Patescibacteria group bacterium]|nr:6-phospho-3-hexuloisomerase [Patescibacteria group bacterium]